MATTSLQKDVIRAAVDQAIAAKQEWLEEVVDGLLSNGVRRNDIMFREFVGENRTEVVVRGVARYQLQLVFKK